MSAGANGKPRILVIRRDNIGDLICTTPLIAALRQHQRGAFIAALVNSYNLEVLDRNPHLDRVFAYGKAKHRGERESLIGTYVQRVKLVLELRRQRFDYAILAAPGLQPRSLRLARLAGAKHIVGFTEGRAGAEGAIDFPVPYGPPAARHEVEDVLRLLAALGITAPHPALHLVPDPELAATMQANVAARLPGDGPLVALHISAR
jgi:ADP-heptose:LPS heptosyltransferase